MVHVIGLVDLPSYTKIATEYRATVAHTCTAASRPRSRRREPRPAARISHYLLMVLAASPSMHLPRMDGPLPRRS